jgi:hypothetical protein
MFAPIGQSEVRFKPKAPAKLHSDPQEPGEYAFLIERIRRLRESQA